MTTLLDDLRSIIRSGQGKAAAAINAEIVQTYWQIGERIVQEEQGGAARAVYGEQVLVRIGRILSAEFGRGFAERSLRFMRQFYLTYPIRSALRTELTWTSYRTLMRLPDDQRHFYERLCIGGRWSSRELDRQINSMLYERTALSRKPEQTLAVAMQTPKNDPLCHCFCLLSVAGGVYPSRVLRNFCRDHTMLLCGPRCLFLQRSSLVADNEMTMGMVR